MSRRLAVALILVLAAACAGPGTDADRTVVAAGAGAAEEAPSTTAPPPTTVAPTPTTTRPAPATTAAPPTTRRPGPPLPSTTPTTAPRPTTTSTTLHAPAATVTAHGATITLTATPRPEVPGFKFTVELTTGDLQYVPFVRYDFGRYATLDLLPIDPGPICSRQPRVVTHSIHNTWPDAGTYRVRAIVTVVPCWPAVGPPGSPPGAPLPDAPHHLVEVSVAVTQQLPMYGR